MEFAITMKYGPFVDRPFPTEISFHRAQQKVHVPAPSSRSANKTLRDVELTPCNGTIWHPNWKVQYIIRICFLLYIHYSPRNTCVMPFLKGSKHAGTNAKLEQNTFTSGFCNPSEGFKIVSVSARRIGIRPIDPNSTPLKIIQTPESPKTNLPILSQMRQMRGLFTCRKGEQWPYEQREM